MGEFEASSLPWPPLPAAPGDHRPARAPGHAGDFAERYPRRRARRRRVPSATPQLRATSCFGAEAEIGRALSSTASRRWACASTRRCWSRSTCAPAPASIRAALGLLTHSGGSSTGNLAVLVSDHVRAHVTDYRLHRRNRRLPVFPVHRETLPAPFPGPRHRRR
ncbi:MAG: hypothetical protein U0802_20355 [Candidatus Binatia bacterium]